MNDFDQAEHELQLTMSLKQQNRSMLQNLKDTMPSEIDDPKYYAAYAEFLAVLSDREEYAFSLFKAALKRRDDLSKR